MAEIVLDHVTKSFPDGTTAVSELNIEIHDGEFIVLVGPSGCGKTTALRMVAGLESLTHGTIRIGERVVNDLQPKERDIDMVFQDYALYPHMTVYDNMAFGLKLRKLSKEEIDGRVRDAARILGLDELLKRKPKALSGGQRQRVAMGRAIVRNPQAFLMDEPLSNLDAKLRVQMRSEIARIQRELGVTTIYVTHDQTEAMTMGDRVAVIRKGVLQQVEAPQYLYEHPVNLFVAGFIGSPAMNLTEATLSRSNGSLDVEFGGFHLALPDDIGTTRPGLLAYEGKRVILGVRPEDIEDARLASGELEHRRMRATVELREALGSDVVVHFSVDSPVVVTEDVKELAADVGQEAVQGLEQVAAHGKSVFLARLNPRTTARVGEALELYVDTGHLHFFDHGSGRGIYAEPG
ncbi:MAG: sn-glycerol-3-phosphate ABC transporter ATP-binding protein UgpC [Actinobacteria bacterium]|nr:MAG: sn-glycerol-3-phosphate ABC transporter ATP-binding protein UgpC [Actinomycetota bacterium]